MEFAQFLEEVAAKGEAVNLVLEGRLFNLVGILQKIAGPLAAASIPHEVAERTRNQVRRNLEYR